MPLRAPEPAASDVVREAVRTFSGGRRFRTDQLRAAEPDSLTLSDPHEVFTLGLDDLRSGAPLRAARPTGWRYLVRSGDRVVAAAESVPAATDPTAQVFAQFNEGPFVTATARALDSARSEPQVAEQHFTQRLFHVPALHAMALWLHPDDGDGDLLVPLAPFPLDVRTGVATPAAPLMRRLAERAAEVPVEPADSRRGG